jgi:hypothetical protein
MLLESENPDHRVVLIFVPENVYHSDLGLAAEGCQR